MKNLYCSLVYCFLFMVIGPCYATALVAAEINDYSCGSLRNAYGPYDYRTDKDKLDVVEAFHFTPEVANLIRGKSGEVGGDIDYTLRAFPNHPRALVAMLQLGDRQKKPRVSGAQYSVECYLNRAIRFRSDDPTIKMIYANYLVKKGRAKDALKQLNDAASLNDGDVSLNYNIALVYTELKEYNQALVFAHRAYQAGFPLPGLRDRLKRAGKWKEYAPDSNEFGTPDRTGQETSGILNSEEVHSKSREK